ncbi:RNA polymerase I-specific transcription-initiation factor domain-containing protein [Orpheovirus IHUMI-LCC2]|uniref:RNA polymerase I-specific transcription-initiation factor domain-containing protein n=1 Tax=Orpheovirus IHUMI-LCC2 TaxID=2023057 RepID=A0A2I2L672_9VIRU|nr:RNA polymerase I-specific transcription-initiation factor domain-containing protein [Orpheovirus IHUMI-LCC2]SNW62959.1 RNA polymerase I-specific transcription-initiation factor domain-containing protein [Orpheovirus IHUMI-LCC2]
MESSSASSIFIIIIIVLVIIFFIVLFSFYIRGQFTSDTTTVPISTNIIDNREIGASVDGIYNLENGKDLADPAICNKAPTRLWQGKGTYPCNCLKPFYGPNCYRESYNAQYFAVGLTDINNIDVNDKTMLPADRLSFTYLNPNTLLQKIQVLCTQRCSDDTTCQGVYWESPPPPTKGTNQREGTCILLKGDVIMDPNAPLPTYDQNIDSNLYMKRPNTVKFPDYVFLYTGNPPSRYWIFDNLNNGNNKLARLRKNVPKVLNFIPTNEINYSELIGIYSSSPINIDSISNIINDPPSNVYIHYPDTPLNVPSSLFVNGSLYVLYTSYNSNGNNINNLPYNDISTTRSTLIVGLSTYQNGNNSYIPSQSPSQYISSQSPSQNITSQSPPQYISSQNPSQNITSQSQPQYISSQNPSQNITSQSQPQYIRSHRNNNIMTNDNMMTGESRNVTISKIEEL